MKPLFPQQKEQVDKDACHLSWPCLDTVTHGFITLYSTHSYVQLTQRAPSAFVKVRHLGPIQEDGVVYVL
jgi:hypothetical protein